MQSCHNSWKEFKTKNKKWQTTVHKNFDYQKKPFCSLIDEKGAPA